MTQSNDVWNRRPPRRSIGVVLAVFVAIALVAAGVSGTVAADSHDAKLDSGYDFYVGQSLSVDMTESDTTYNIYEVDENDEAASRVLAFETNGTGVAVIDTEDLDEGPEYVIGTNRSNIVTVEDGVGQDNGNSSATGKTFRFTQQGLSVEFGDDTVEQGDTADVTVDSALRFDSEYDVEITSDDLSTDDLVGVFGGTETDDGTVVAADSLTTADFADVDPGEYTFTFDVTDTTASDTASITVEEESDVDVTLPEMANVDRGDVASIPVELEGTDTAYVAIGTMDYAGFRTVAEVNDGNEDGKVTLKANTFNLVDHNASQRTQLWTADSNDSVKNVWHEGPDYDKAIFTGSYNVRATSDYNSSSERLLGDKDRTVLRVVERSTEDVSPWTAPANSDISDFEDVADAISEDSLTESQFIAEGDYAVAELEATGIFGALEAQPGSSNAEKLASLDENVSSLNVSIVEPAESALGGDSEMDLSANTDALTVITNQDDGQLFVLMDTDALDLEDSDQRVTRFTVNGGTPLATGADDTTVEKAFEMRSPTVEFDENNVSPAADQTISGATNLAPGTELTLSVESAGSSDSESAFQSEFTATVQTDGSWSGEADFSEGTDRQGYTVEVVEPEISAEYDDEIGRPTASMSVANVTEDSVTVDSVNLSEGGFVVVKTDSETGSFADVTEYLEPGRHSDLEIPVSGVSDGDTVYAVAHTDANGNEEYDGDAAYTNADGSPVSESATVSAGLDWPSEPAPTDPDGDGLYEDVNGNDQIDFPDVNMLFQRADTAAIQDNEQYFDFTGDGSVDLQDVLALFEMV